MRGDLLLFRENEEIDRGRGLAILRCLPAAHLLGKVG